VKAKHEAQTLTLQKKGVRVCGGEKEVITDSLSSLKTIIANNLTLKSVHDDGEHCDPQVSLFAIQRQDKFVL
jgi:hypothetical protein